MYAPKGQKFNALPDRTHIHACYDPPPLRTYSYSTNPSLIFNGKVCRYTLNNFVKKKTVKLLKDRKIIIANAR